MLVFIGLDSSILDTEGLGLQEDLLPYDLVDMLDGGLGLGARLVLVGGFAGVRFAEFETLVGVIEVALVGVVVATVEIGSGVVGVLGGGGFGELNLGGGIVFEGDPAPETREDGGYFGGVLGGLGSEVLMASVVELRSIRSETIS